MCPIPNDFRDRAHLTVQWFGLGAQYCPSLPSCCAIVGLLWKTPHIVTNVEYAGVLYVCSFGDGSATAAAEEYRRGFPLRRIPNRGVFSKVFHTLRECDTLPSVRVSSEGAFKQITEEQENILDMYSVALLVAREDSTRLGVSRTRVWGTLQEEDSMYPFHPQPVQNIHPGDSAVHLEFCHWLRTNRQLLPWILFTDEATFTRNGINNTCNSHRCSHENPHGTVEINFQRRFSSNVWCDMIDYMLIGPVILDGRLTGQNYIDFCEMNCQKN